MQKQFLTYKTIQPIMEEKNFSKLSAMLNADFNNEESIWLTKSKTLRKTIGYLGMALPFFLIISLYISTGFWGTLESISHYYYTRISGVFIGILSILAIFLIIYKGNEPKDLLVSVLAGISALFVVLFPTGNITDICHDATKAYAVTILPNSAFRENFHYISAAVFLGSLAYMSIFLFTKSNKIKTLRGTKKRFRNRIYRTCGIIMIIAMLTILSSFIFEKLGMASIWTNFYDKYKLTFWMEALAIESFGFSWLIKGETLFKDEEQP